MLTPQKSRGGRGSDGMTLVELVIASAVASLVFGLLVPLVISSMRNNNRLSAHVTVAGDVQRAMDRVTRDLRAANPIVSATSTAVTLRIRRSGQCNEVTYAVLNSATTSETVNGYTATGKSFVATTASCVMPTVVTSTLVLVRAVPVALTPFAFANKDGVALPPTFATQADRNGIYRVAVSLQAPDIAGRQQALNTDVDVRNASA